MTMTPYRKRLRHQSWYRGCKETDDILGPFADEFLPACSDEDATGFEALLDEDDWDIWRWLTGEQPIPVEHQPLIEKITTFQAKLFQ